MVIFFIGKHITVFIQIFTCSLRVTFYKLNAHIVLGVRISIGLFKYVQQGEFTLADPFQLVFRHFISELCGR